MSETAIKSFEPVAAFAAVARALTESLELPEVLKRIASEVLALTDALGVSVVMPREGGAEFVAHESPPPHSRIPVGFRFEPAPALIDVLRHRREPLTILDLHASPLIPAVIKEQITARDLVLMPLRIDDDLLGALILAFEHLPEEWPWDPTLLRAVGDQAAVAIRNAQLYESARDSSEQLLRAERLTAMGRVVARVAHQLNNPLTTARLIVEALEAETLPQPALEQLRGVSREMERAATVVRDLLIFSRKAEHTLEPIAVGEVIERVVEAHRVGYEAASVQLTTEIAPSLPTMLANAHGIDQVLSNLLTNAGQAVAATPEPRRIAVRGWLDGPDRDALVVEVEDNGPGIPDAVRRQIFDPFFTTKPTGAGTGLGLAIAREIVEAHHGVLDAETVPGGGALFRLRLPVIAPETTPVTAEPPRPADSAPPRGLRVLIIDDEPQLQQALRRVVTFLGCEAESALSGEEGIERARADHFDLILCDMFLPGLGGREIYTRLSDEAPHTLDALAFTTGDALTSEVRDFLASTGRPVLFKPFGRAQIQEILLATAAREH